MRNQIHREMESAKLLGIEYKKGWRKKLIKLRDTENGAKLLEGVKYEANRVIAKKNGRARLNRVLAGPVNGCPYELHPEFSMVGVMFSQLLEKGFDAHLEVSVPSDQHVSGWMRIDIGIISSGKLIHAIEVKREGKGLSKSTRQAKAYRYLRDNYGVNIHFINRADEVKNLIARLLPDGAVEHMRNL